MPTERPPLFKGRPQAPLNGWMQGGAGGWMEGSPNRLLLLSSLYWKCPSILCPAFGSELHCSGGCHPHVLVDAISRGVALLSSLLLLCSDNMAGYFLRIHPAGLCKALRVYYQQRVTTGEELYFKVRQGAMLLFLELFFNVRLAMMLLLSAFSSLFSS